MRRWAWRILHHPLLITSVLVSAVFRSLAAGFRTRAALQLEILALLHPLGILQRSVKQPKLTAADRYLWVWLCRLWRDGQSALVLVKACRTAMRAACLEHPR